MRRAAAGLAIATVAMGATVALVIGGLHALAPPPPVCDEPPPPPASPPVPQPPPTFDLLACATDLGRGALAPERRGPPPVMPRFALHSRRELDAAARAISTALPARWHVHVELDATGMETSVELHVDGTRPPADTAQILLALVRAHPCLFGVVAPAELTATGDGSVEHQVIRFDEPHAIGNLYASADSEGHADHVAVASHLWPLADRAPVIEPSRMLAGYLAHAYGVQSGWRYLIDPATHVHTGCSPIVSDRVADVSAFRWRAGPLLACRGSYAEVVYGARVDLHGAMRRDAVLATLPTALLPDGTPVPVPRVAPAARDVDGVDFLHDLGECPPTD
ncbi:MAG TPA: hypothetical protein VGF94_05780 [Kofleriaceae bacterium]|jgi:hypothetical protein